MKNEGDTVMKLKTRVIILLMTGVFFSAQTVWAGPATREIAMIMMNLSHYPSKTDKEKLSGISANPASTKGERILASALLNMEHRVSDADRAKLQELKNDTTASAAERELADILMNINHKPSEADKARLHKLH
jgi:hypothetical protein